MHLFTSNSLLRRSLQITRASIANGVVSLPPSLSLSIVGNSVGKALVSSVATLLIAQPFLSPKSDPRNDLSHDRDHDLDILSTDLTRQSRSSPQIVR